MRREFDERYLGEGGSARVFRAFDPLIARPVAIKFLTECVDSKELAWLKSEARAAGKLHHRNVVSIFGLVLDIFGITLDNVLTRLARRAGRAVADRLRTVINVLTGAWEWVAVLFREGPAGLWKKLEQRLSDLWKTLLDGVIGWVTRTVIERVTIKLLSMLDPTGVMAAVNSIIALYRVGDRWLMYRRLMDNLMVIGDTLVDSYGADPQQEQTAWKEFTNATDQALANYNRTYEAAVIQVAQSGSSQPGPGRRDGKV